MKVPKTLKSSVNETLLNNLDEISLGRFSLTLCGAGIVVVKGEVAKLSVVGPKQLILSRVSLADLRVSCRTVLECIT